MVILGLDTTTASGSVALRSDGELLEARRGDPTRTHGERLPGDLLALLETHALSLSDVDVYAVCSGPGSFTGLRVGLATIQGLALVNRKPVVPVPTLEALSWAALWETAGESQTAAVGAWMNAHRDEVFAALYRVPAQDRTPSNAPRWSRLVPIVDSAVGRPATVVGTWRHQLSPGGVMVIGDAVGAHRRLLDDALGGTSHRLTLLTEVPPLGAVAARIAEASIAHDGGVSPYAVHPVYVRRPDAELARERRHHQVDMHKR